jgi:hypothetical protein
MPMRRPRSSCLVLVAALALSGCSYGDTVLDWATGTTAATNTGAADTTISNKPSATDANPQPTVSAPQRPPASGGATAPASGTLLGQKIQSLHADAAQFQGSVERLQTDFAATRQSLGNNAGSYSDIIAGVNTRLQAGTTAGNPDLVAQWGQAQSLLDQTNNSVTHLVGISNEAANDSSFGTFVLKEIRAAFDLRGVAESDRDELRQLEGQTSAALTQVDQLHTAVTGEIAHQNAYVAGERNNLTALALAIQDGRASGPSVASRPAAAAGVAAAPNAVAPRSAAPGRASTAPAAGASGPLVVIRFDQPNVDYEEPLYKAVNGALQRKPNATFTVQAVAPQANSAAEVAANTNASRDNATKVLRSLTAMGMPADRLSLSATMSPDIQGSEVRIFVR